MRYNSNGTSGSVARESNARNAMTPEAGAFFLSLALWDPSSVVAHLMPFRRPFPLFRMPLECRLQSS